MSALENSRESLLVSQNIPKSIIMISLPMMITGLSDALYNMIDSIFVGKFIGDKALAALSVNATISISLLSIAALYGTGLSSIISRALGSKNYEKVMLTVINGVILAFVSTALLSFLMLINLDKVLTFIGSSEDILYYAREYGQIMLWFGFLIPIKSVLDALLRSKGEVKYIMYLSIFGATLNIVLDALFIITFKWGIEGAAWATIISQLIVVSILLYIVKKVYSVHFRFYYLKQITLSWILEIYSIGISSFLRSFTFALFSLSANRVLAVYGIMAVASFGVVNRILHFAYQPIFGSNLGTQALIGYNYGAKNYIRVNDIIITAIKIATIMGLCFSAIFVWAPKKIFLLFTNSLEIITYAQNGLRIVGITFFLYGLQIFSTGSLLAMGHPKMALFLSIFRPLIMVIFMNILPYFFAEKGVWYTFPIVDIISSIVTWCIMRKELLALRKKEELLKNVLVL